MAEQVGGIYYEVTADTSKLIGQQREVERATGQMAASFNVITTAIKVMALAMAAVKAAQMADDMRLLSARVLVAAGSIEAAASAMERLVEISTRTQTSVSANVQVFTRLNQSILQMGGTQSQTLKITELLGMAIKVGGASATEASSAMLQFGQALGSGKLAGDELRSLLENAPYLMRQLAAGLGVPVGALKSLGEQGKLTADVVVNALSKAATQITADFQKMPQTLSGALTVAEDAFKRLNKQVDDNTQKSAILTGAVKGVGEVFDALSKQIEENNKKSAELNRDDNIKAWADRTKYGLSYVLDVADKLRQITNDYARAADEGFIGKAARGLVGIAKSYGRALGIGGGEDQEPTTAGARMRQSWEAGPAPTWGREGGRMAAEPRLKSAATATPSTFDALAYLAKLREATAEEYAKIGLVEQEALRKNAKQEGLSLEQRAEAARLIQMKAAEDRADLASKIEDKIIADANARAREREQDERRQSGGRAIAQGIIGAADPLAALQFELDAKSKMLAEYAEKDRDNEALYAQARVALEQETQRKIAEIVEKRNADALAQQQQVLANYQNMFNSLTEITKGFAGEQSGAYKAMFAVSKAFAIADAMVKIQQGIANAMSLPYPANIAAAASTAAAAASIVSTIKGVSFGGGRQYGGPAMSGTLYRVNETGRPEMFTAANGSQFMLPTADGQVTPAGGTGGSGKVVNNYFSVNVQGDASENTLYLIQQAQAQFAAQLASENN